MNIKNYLLQSCRFYCYHHQRFDQPTFKLFPEAEQLFLKMVGKHDVTNELKALVMHFKCGWYVSSLFSELQLLPTIFECEPINLEEVARALISLSQEKRMLVGNCVTVIRIILNAGATFTIPQKSFLMLRSTKT